MRNKRVKKQCESNRLSEGEITQVQRNLRTVVEKRVPLSSKKRLINRRGGFLVPLLSAVLPTLASLTYNSLSSS